MRHSIREQSKDKAARVWGLCRFTRVRVMGNRTSDRDTFIMSARRRARVLCAIAARMCIIEECGCATECSGDIASN